MQLTAQQDAQLPFLATELLPKQAFAFCFFCCLRRLEPGRRNCLCEVPVSPFLWLCHSTADLSSSLPLASPFSQVMMPWWHVQPCPSVLHPIIKTVNEDVDEYWVLGNRSITHLPVGFCPADHYPFSLTDPDVFPPMLTFPACVLPAWLKGDYRRLFIALLKSC